MVGGFDDVRCLKVEFEVCLDVYTKEFGDLVLLDVFVFEGKFEIGMVSWVEGCVCGFGFVRGEVVSLEVVDERGEVSLGFVLELFDRWC